MCGAYSGALPERGAAATKKGWGALMGSFGAWNPWRDKDRHDRDRHHKGERRREDRHEGRHEDEDRRDRHKNW